MGQLEGWVLSIRWLIGALVFLGIASLLIVAAYTGLRVLLLHLDKKQGEREEHARTHLPDGRVRPPVGEGLCDRCQRAGDAVYYLPSGRRLCAACFAVEDQVAGPGGRGPDGGVDS